LRTSSIQNINLEKSVVGVGLNGNITGYIYRSGTVDLDDMVMKNVTANVIESTEPDGASIGMGALKNYIVVLNYCQAYASFRENFS
jgi:predicted aspartyl protease